MPLAAAVGGGRPLTQPSLSSVAASSSVEERTVITELRADVITRRFIDQAESLYQEMYDRDVHIRAKVHRAAWRTVLTLLSFAGFTLAIVIIDFLLLSNGGGGVSGGWLSRQEAAVATATAANWTQLAAEAEGMFRGQGARTVANRMLPTAITDVAAFAKRASVREGPTTGRLNDAGFTTSTADASADALSNGARFPETATIEATIHAMFAPDVATLTADAVDSEHAYTGCVAPAACSGSVQLVTEYVRSVMAPLVGQRFAPLRKIGGYLVGSVLIAMGAADVDVTLRFVDLAKMTTTELPGSSATLTQEPSSQFAWRTALPGAPSGTVTLPSSTQRSTGLPDAAEIAASAAAVLSPWYTAHMNLVPSDWVVSQAFATQSRMYSYDAGAYHKPLTEVTPLWVALTPHRTSEEYASALEGLAWLIVSGPRTLTPIEPNASNDNTSVTTAAAAMISPVTASEEPSRNVLLVWLANLLSADAVHAALGSPSAPVGNTVPRVMAPTTKTVDQQSTLSLLREVLSSTLPNGTESTSTQGQSQPLLEAFADFVRRSDEIAFHDYVFGSGGNRTDHLPLVLSFLIAIPGFERERLFTVLVAFERWSSRGLAQWSPLVTVTAVPTVGFSYRFAQPVIQRVTTTATAAGPNDVSQGPVVLDFLDVTVPSPSVGRGVLELTLLFWVMFLLHWQAARLVPYVRMRWRLAGGARGLLYSAGISGIMTSAVSALTRLAARCCGRHPSRPAQQAGWHDPSDASGSAAVQARFALRPGSVDVLVSCMSILLLVLIGYRGFLTALSVGVAVPTLLPEFAAARAPVDYLAAVPRAMTRQAVSSGRRRAQLRQLLDSAASRNESIDVKAVDLMLDAIAAGVPQGRPSSGGFLCPVPLVDRWAATSVVTNGGTVSAVVRGGWDYAVRRPFIFATPLQWLAWLRGGDEPPKQADDPTGADGRGWTGPPMLPCVLRDAPMLGAMFADIKLVSALVQLLAMCLAAYSASFAPHLGPVTAHLRIVFHLRVVTFFLFAVTVTLTLGYAFFFAFGSSFSEVATFDESFFSMMTSLGGGLAFNLRYPTSGAVSPAMRFLLTTIFWFFVSTCFTVVTWLVVWSSSEQLATAGKLWWLRRVNLQYSWALQGDGKS